MQVVLYFYPSYKNIYNFSKWKVVKPPTRSIDSSYAEQSNPHFHTKHHLNRLTNLYIKKKHD